jgi:hypothetical protein
MLPPLPVKCRVDGILTDFHYDRPWHTARVHVTTPALPGASLDLGEGQATVEKFDPDTGEWLTGSLRALEDLGPVPYGYVKYRTPFTFNGEPKMFITARADDAKKVFVNGHHVPEGSNREKLVEFPLAKYAQPGANLVEISYELFGAPNFGENIGELKGLASVGIGADFPSAKGLENWQIQRYSVRMRGREAIDVAPVPHADPAHAPTRRGVAAAESEGVQAWTPASFLGGGGSPAMVPAFTWCRAQFPLPSSAEVWKAPWKLVFDADCDALIFLNGKFVGRYVTLGPQRDFFLPEPYLALNGAVNSLMFLLAYTDQPNHLRSLQVVPYAEFAVRRTRVEFEW